MRARGGENDATTRDATLAVDEMKSSSASYSRCSISSPNDERIELGVPVRSEGIGLRSRLHRVESLTFLSHRCLQRACANPTHLRDGLATVQTTARASSKLSTFHCTR
jgi:hypothetical protein